MWRGAKENPHISHHRGLEGCGDSQERELELRKTKRPPGEALEGEERSGSPPGGTEKPR